ncbi:hypothetical protein BV20DRAFT_960808 [Pilatotrama ljubarskyi]|nr:hypothetical protein BV20DRAFT_960808 [Pilatotrama ljubarskyi]
MRQILLRDGTVLASLPLPATIGRSHLPTQISTPPNPSTISGSCSPSPPSSTHARRTDLSSPSPLLPALGHRPLAPQRLHDARLLARISCVVQP